MTLSDILRVLPTLEQEELRKIKMTCDFMLKGLSGKSVDSVIVDEVSSDEASLFYSALVEELGRLGVTTPPWHAFQRLDIYKNYQANFPLLEQYVAKTFPSVNLRDRQRLYYLFAGIVAQKVKEWDLPLTLGVVCRNLNKVPSLVAGEFPGYAESGLLSIVLQWGNRNAGT